MEIERGDFLVAVDDGGNQTMTTQFTSGPLAHPIPHRSLELSAHGIIHWVGAFAFIHANARPSSRGDGRFMGGVYIAESEPGKSWGSRFRCSAKAQSATR